MSKIYEALEVIRKSKEREGQHMPAPIRLPQRKPVGRDAELVVVSRPSSFTAEAFRFLRSKIMRPATGDPFRTILVTSAVQGDGKTFVACNLAATISQSFEEYALLIDADIRNPSAHRNLGLHFEKLGLSTYLTGDAPLASVMKKTKMDKLTILPAGNSTTMPSELLSSEKMKLLIREVRDRYPDRFIIIDGPPLELAPETAVMANEVDAIILVIRYGQTPRSSVQSAIKRIQKQKLLGIIFNGYNEPLKSHYGYYRYGAKD